MIPGAAVPALLGDGGQYQISKSLRLRAAVVAYLTRTPATTTSFTKWTYSLWVKRGSLSLVTQALLGAGSDTNNYGAVSFSNDTLLVTATSAGTAICSVATAAVFRDPSSHMHICVTYDSTQATATNRVSIEVNGVKQTIGGSPIWPALNASLFINTTNQSTIGIVPNFSATVFDGLISNVELIDGQALTSSSFAQVDPATGMWVPKKYAGTYGTNGFYLNFSDNSAATATTIGKDSSGNGNNWTPTNISVTAGVTNDSLIDVPTDYSDSGNGRGNYPTLNPLQGSGTRAQGNLAATGAYRVGSTQLLPKTGKWYAEFSCSGTSTSADFAVGVGTQNLDGTTHPNPGAALYYSDNQYVIVNGSNLGNFAATASSTDIVQVAYDADTGKLYLGKNNTFYLATAGTGNPSAGTNPSTTLSAGDWQIMTYTTTNNTVAYANFGQRPFAYTPPTGFKALNTLNLPDPLIKLTNKYFDATGYAGTGSAKSVSNAGAFQPDLVWSKSRSAASSNILADSTRGATVTLVPNSPGAESTDATMYSAFNSDGFSIGTNTALNTSGGAYIGWQWKKGATPGFDIVSYTGNDTARSISHSLGAVPTMKIIKQRTGTRDWFANHRSISSTSYLLLDGNDAVASASSVFSGSDTSSVFTLGTNAAVNGGGVGYMAYLWSEVPGFSKFGSYTGNGSTDGPFVSCGFTPKYVMIKRTDTTGSWVILDTTRSPSNQAIAILYANIANAEDTSGGVDFLSNGFKARVTNTDLNASGGTYIYMAFSANPFKYSRAR